MGCLRACCLVVGKTCQERCSLELGLEGKRHLKVSVCLPQI
jgi:hypothetical protein